MMWDDPRSARGEESKAERERERGKREDTTGSHRESHMQSAMQGKTTEWTRCTDWDGDQGGMRLKRSWNRKDAGWDFDEDKRGRIRDVIAGASRMRSKLDCCWLEQAVRSHSGGAHRHSIEQAVLLQTAVVVVDSDYWLQIDRFIQADHCCCLSGDSDISPRVH